MRYISLLAPVSLLTVALSSPATAQVRPGGFEVSAYGGIWEGDGRFDDAPTFGGRVMYHINRLFGVELSYGVALSTVSSEVNIDDSNGEINPENISTSDEDITVHNADLDLVVHLSDTPFTPYVSLGIGMVEAEEVGFGPDVAIGAKYYFHEDWAARGDVRAYFSDDDQFGDTFFHTQATLGVTYQVAGDYDIDDDGIPNRKDKCKTMAEDRDGHQDTDGCPDPDNDADGVADAEDKCPDAKEDADGDKDDDGCPDIDGDEDGVDDANDKCPAEKEDLDKFEDEDGCPDLDNDADGVKDTEDKCPLKKEDADGFQDKDGCPDTDNDGDGILDAQDKCPNKPEDKNGVDDDDGCPGPPKKVVIKAGKLEILEKVFFASGKDKILDQSNEILDQVALALKQNPEIKRVEIQGHTDDKGSSSKNLRLSQKRADAVRAYLIGKGVEGNRLDAKGYGEDKPLDPAKNKAAREKNRRVEFVILEQEGA